MPVDFNTAQGLINAQGVQPPEGVTPGSPQYQQWAVEWLQNAVNAGVPEAVQASGGVALGQGGTTAGWEQEGGYVLDPNGANAAAPDEWIGKRKPTPSELRRASADNYKNEWGKEGGYGRYSDRQLAAWIDQYWDVDKGGFFTTSGEWVSKPPDSGQDGSFVQGWTPSPGTAGGGGGGGGGGGYGGAPQLELPEFVPPDWETVQQDPGYQFALGEGQKALEGSAAAKGMLRTGGTLKDLMNFGQGLATQHYGDAYNRAANTYNLNTGAQIQEFQPNWNAWNTTWTNQYQGDLQKYLQKESNIFGLLNQPPPMYPGY